VSNNKTAAHRASQRISKTKFKTEKRKEEWNKKTPSDK
jgi:hypothetical protein